jgi:hypothetical protein
MKCHKETVVKITLELDENEANWLKNITQNPLFEKEEVIDSIMRRKFFEALSESGKALAHQADDDIPFLIYDN